MGTPDMAWQPWLMGMRRAMEALLTGDALTGVEAVAAGVANRAYPVAELDDQVIEHAKRIAMVDADLLALNKRVLHRAMETMGIRTAMRATTELQALSRVQDGPVAHRAELKQSVRGALSTRDARFGDYRESGTD
jgi:enoyl-CoA hydratase